MTLKVGLGLRLEGAPPNKGSEASKLVLGRLRREGTP